MPRAGDPRRRRHEEHGDAEAADEVRERRDVVERVVDERKRDAVEQGGEHERGLCREARVAHRRGGRPSRASGW